MRWACAAVVAVLGFLVPVAAAIAQGAQDGLGSARPGPELKGRVPYLLNWLRPDVLAVIDPLRGDLVFLNDNGSVLGRSELPYNFVPDAAFMDQASIRFVSADGDSAIVVPRSVDVSKLPAFVVGTAKREALDSVAKDSNGRILLLLTSEGRKVPVAFSPELGGVLGKPAVLGKDQFGNTYVKIEEGIVAPDGTLDVRVSVSRIDSKGKNIGRVRLPIELMQSVPPGFVTVTGSGDLRLLITDAAGTRIRKIRFEGSAGGAQPLGDDAGPRAAVVDVGVTSYVEDQGQIELSAEPMSEQEPPLTISTMQIISNAKRYLRVNWTLRPSNLGDDERNKCWKEGGYFWKRPKNLTSAQIGTVISAMPYKWGGGDSVKKFIQRIERGDLAGSVCTCRDSNYGNCVVEAATGIDCSGLVSAAWGVRKLGTGQLGAIAVEIRNPNDIQPGDAFIRPGNHVILIEKKLPGPGFGVRTIESTVALGCEGVCRRDRDISAFSKYKIIRRLNVTQ